MYTYRYPYPGNNKMQIRFDSQKCYIMAMNNTEKLDFTVSKFPSWRKQLVQRYFRSILGGRGLNKNNEIPLSLFDGLLFLTLFAGK